MSQSDIQHIIEGVVQALDPRLKSIEAHIANVEDRITKVEERMGTVEERIGKVEHRLHFIEEDTRAFKGRLASIEEILDDMRAEQRLVLQATTNNLADIMRLKDRLELRAS